MVHTALTENATKKPTIFTPIQTTRHKSLKKFHDHLKKDSQFCHHLKIFFRGQPFTIKMPKNSGYKTKLQYQQPKENNQNKKKRKRNIIWFKPPYRKLVKIISGEYPSN